MTKEEQTAIESKFAQRVLREYDKAWEKWKLAAANYRHDDTRLEEWFSQHAVPSNNGTGGYSQRLPDGTHMVLLYDKVSQLAQDAAGPKPYLYQMLLSYAPKKKVGQR